jgi:hypothetical protein
LLAIYENEARATYDALLAHINALIIDANKKYGENNWSLNFNVDGMHLNIKRCQIKSTIIVFEGKNEDIECEIGQHYSNLKYTAFIIPNKNGNVDTVGSNIVKFAPKDEQKS